MCEIRFPHPWLKFFLTSLAISICFLNSNHVFAKVPAGAETIEGPPQTIHGIVKDASNGARLSGATINVKGGSQSTASDTKGAFSITVPDNKSILVVSYIGYV